MKHHALKINADILRIALPSIVSNITVPLMGIFSTAIAGHWGDSAHTIGALAIGVSIFNFIYWNCSFVRMGTSGLTAQAFGAGDFAATTAMLARAVLVVAILGIGIVALQYPIGKFSLWAMNGDNMVAEYYYARIWAVPAGVLLFALNGWLNGMQNAVVPMVGAIVVNVLHVVFSLWLAFSFDMGIVGIAYASVIAQWGGVLLTAILTFILFRHKMQRIAWREILDMKPMGEFFRINRDIFARTLCIVAVYTFFTAASARMDDGITLAVNTMLLQLFTLFSYMNDGFAYAAEALTGRFIGARDRVSLRNCIRWCFVWAFLTSFIAIGAYIGWWQELLALFLPEGAEDTAAILATAGRYIGWIIAIPLAAALPFLMDGIMIGASFSRIMRDSMFLSTVAYFVIYYALYPLIGNNALWLAFSLYMFLRGILQIVLSRGLHKVYASCEK